MDEETFKTYMKALNKQLHASQNIVFFCIGTDRVIGDCVGPIIGSLLIEKYGKNNVYGDLYNNITFENIVQTLSEINERYNEPYIIAIDAALSTPENIGKIFVDESGINFGDGLGKNFNKIGNIGIKVVVGKDYNNPQENFRALQNIPLSKILNLSKKTFEGITSIMNK